MAYGGVATVLSALALSAIAASLLLQRQQTRIAQIFSMRERHFDLIRLSLDYPELMAVAVGRNYHQEAAVTIYANAWISYWHSLWELQALSEDGLRRSSAPMFETQSVRDWWNRVSPGWLIGTWSTGGRRFVQVLNEECDRATQLATAHTSQVDVAPASSTISP